VLLGAREEQAMKRFPTPCDLRHQLHRIFVATMLAVAVLALLNEAVQAQSSPPASRSSAFAVSEAVE
jgi:hypothetical protein